MLFRLAVCLLLGSSDAFGSMPDSGGHAGEDTGDDIPLMVPDCRLVGPGTEVSEASADGLLWSLVDGPQQVTAGTSFPDAAAFCSGLSCEIMMPGESMPDSGTFYTYSAGQPPLSMMVVMPSDTATTIGVFCSSS